MAKALRQIKDQQKIVDLFIIVLDGRAPLSCYNPEFNDVINNKMRLFVISKVDMADETKLYHIYKKLPQNDGVILLNLKQHNSFKKLSAKINAILQTKKERDFKKGLIKVTLKVAVIGVPNVGKSTLINLLAKKQKTKVANIPGVTRGKQWINSGQMLLLDTPGVLWPKIDDRLIGVKLATIGLIKDAIINKNELLYASYQLVSQTYPQKLIDIDLLPAHNEQDIAHELEKLCQKHKFFLKNNTLDWKRGQTYLLNYFKNLHGITYD